MSKEEALQAFKAAGHTPGNPYLLRDDETIFNSRDCTARRCCARVDMEIAEGGESWPNGYATFACPAIPGLLVPIRSGNEDAAPAEEGERPRPAREH